MRVAQDTNGVKTDRVSADNAFLRTEPKTEIIRSVVLDLAAWEWVRI